MKGYHNAYSDLVVFIAEEVTAKVLNDFGYE